MANHVRWASGPGLAVLAGAILATGGRAQGQMVVQPPPQLMSGMQAPQFPAAGDWAQVVTVTPKWLVIQNEAGQQFPVAFESVAQFIIRWPTSVDLISPDALVETIGFDLASSRISTDHIDVYEGSARQLVSPLFQRVIGFNRRPTMFDTLNQNLYGVRTPLLPGEDQIPDRHHVVGPLVNRDPVQIAIQGNNALTVFPSVSGMTFSEVKPGSSSYLRAGDMVYVVPADYSTRSLLISQMVGYKKIPFSQFVP